MYRMRKQGNILSGFSTGVCRMRKCKAEPYTGSVDTDIFFSVACRKKCIIEGIAHLAVPEGGMVFDCEPLYFSCNGKSYLLELWKGQYGMSTGAGIGFYPAERSAS